MPKFWKLIYKTKNKMKILVVYYSRTGNTKKIGQEIAKKLNADVDEIIDLKDRSGIRGWLGGGRDAFFKKPTNVKFEKSSVNYDLVIIGTPIWTGTATPAIKAYLSESSFNKVAFFCTFGGNHKDTFEIMEKICGSSPLATIALRDKEVNDEESREKVDDFVQKIKQEKFS